MDFKVVYIVFSLAVLASGRPRRGDMGEATEIPLVPEKTCSGKPADVVFVLDESSSIWGEHFETMLKPFVKDIVSIFDISPTRTRVGALTFGDVIRLAFHLDDFATKPDVIKAVSKIRQQGGNTNTAGALRYMREKMFTDRHLDGRDLEKVVKIGIVITDGESGDPMETARQARMARKEGIHLFAIGVGNAKEEELHVIASHPSEKFVFTVSGYGYLDTIKDMLAMKTCQVTVGPTTPEPTTTPTTTPVLTTPSEPMVADRAQGCGHRRPADVIFITPESASVKDTKKAIRFIRHVSEELDVSDKGVHVGLVPKQCHAIADVALDDYTDKDKLVSHLDQAERQGANTAQQLHYLRTRSMNQCHGARPESKKIAVVILDEQSEDTEATLAEAEKLKKDGVEVFVIAVGKDTDPKEVEAIASARPEQHIIYISDYSELSEVAKRLRRSLDDACLEFFL